MTYIPNADRRYPFAGLSYEPNYPKRLVIHITAGSSIDGALPNYNRGMAPQLTVERNGVIYQHMSLDKAGKALVNRAGGVETNRGGAIQIEIVGRNENDITDLQIESLKRITAFVRDNYRVQMRVRRWYEPRMTGDEWRRFDAICGHRHVPENDSPDPYSFDLERILPNQPNTNNEDDDMPRPDDVVDGYVTQYGGTYTLQRDGGVFARNGAPFYGSYPGLRPEHRQGDRYAVSIKPTEVHTPSGVESGYVVLFSDGNAYTFHPSMSKDLFL